MILLLRKRTILIASFIAAFCVIGYGAVQLGHYINDSVLETSACANWGLSFGQDGTPPAANATAAYLKKFGAYYAEMTEDKNIYLTFDAGYENGNTASILDTLKKHNVKAAFFLVGNYLKTSPELVRRMAEEGHTVGNHTYSHPDMSKIQSMESFKKEITEMEDMYREVTGLALPKYYRPPQGKYSEDNLKMAQELGYTTIFWSLAYVDWYENDQPTSYEAFEKLIPRIHAGAVVLLHSTSKTNSEILDELLSKWEAMGYRFKTLDELVCRDVFKLSKILKYS